MPVPVWSMRAWDLAYDFQYHFTRSQALPALPGNALSRTSASTLTTGSEPRARHTACSRSMPSLM